MLRKINQFLSDVPMTIAGGVFLLFSLLLPKAGISLPIDPAWFSVLICGIPLLYLALWRLRYRPGISKISSALLIVMAMFAAIAVGDLFAAGEVAFIMALGAILEECTTNRAKKGLQKLLTLTPAQGRRILHGQEELIPAACIQKDDILRVLPGETIPADGIILCGETSVDQSILTGESLPVEKSTGEDVFCGTINRFGSIDLCVSRVGNDSSLQKLIRMVQEAEEKQAPMQRIADRCASWLVPTALLIAIVTGLATQNLTRAVTVLVVFCPCALVLATPTAIMAAIGQATKHGVIIKSGEALEKMGRIHTIAFDKTGTLTRGCLEVYDIIPMSEDPEVPGRTGSSHAVYAEAQCERLSRQAASPKVQCERLGGPAAAQDMQCERLLFLAASAEARSEHPIGRAVAACAKTRGLETVAPEFFQMDAGKGVCADISGQRICCGNEKYLFGQGISVSRQAKDLAEQLSAQGKASVLVAADNQCIGILGLSDVLRPEAADIIQKLSALHTNTILLTGDNERAARYFARQTGITELYAGLLPEEKVEHIRRLQEQGGICMIGDGVNDAPALKTASVGVAMGSIGSDIAIEAADIALIGDDLSKIPYLKWLSDTTSATIKGSIALSMCINFLAVTCSVLGFLTPTTGALVHNAGSCLVVLIAALLYDRKYN